VEEAMKFSETVNRVIGLATKIREYWDRELPKRHPNYPILNSPDDDDGPPPPEEAELREFLESLPSEDVYKLMSVGNPRLRTWENRSPPQIEQFVT
jgi:hypothetical protein